MEFFLSFLLLVLNLIDYHYNINSILFLVVSAALVGGLFAVSIKKTGNFLASAIVLLCATWQISWINILGAPTEQLQLPWFYIIGVLIVGYALVRFNDIRENNNNAAILLTFIVMLVISVFPVLNSPSKGEGMKEFIMIAFFLALTFIAFLLSDDFGEKGREAIVDAYIWAIFLTSVFIIVQTAAYHIFGVVLFKYEIGNYMGHTQTGAMLLMEDTSCATIAMGCAVFYILERLDLKRMKIYLPALICVVSAMAMTTRRTSVISLIIVLALYFFFHYKGIMKRSLVMILYVALVVIMVAYMTVVRPVDNLSQYLYENERFANYLRALELAIESPFGIGYDNVNLATQMTDGVIPHNTVLRWLAMGGFWFIIPMIILLGYFTVTAAKKKLSSEFWILLYSLFASNFIPDLYNARFFVIPCMTVLLAAGSNGIRKKERGVKLSGN